MKKLSILLIGVLIAVTANSQQFEEDKIDGSSFGKVNAWIGADFAMQYQSLDMVGTMADGSDFMPLGSGLNLPSANLNIYGDLAPGMRVRLTTFLSSRHHNDTWVKGGYLLIDQAPFLNSELFNKIMKDLTLKIGVMEINYGDGHFRRSDNANVIRNPFVGNYIMDAYTTAPALEAMFRNHGWIAMAAATSGALKPQIVGYTDNGDENQTAADFTTYSMFKELGFYGKFGFDKQLDKDIRLRVTVSPYLQAKSYGGTLYYGDRAGARFYSVMEPASLGSAATDITSNAFNGRWGPGTFTKDNSVMLNTFLKVKGFELFGLLENAQGDNSSGNFNYTQFAADALYRFGKTDQFYVGGKYNIVSNDNDEKAHRTELAGGWFLTRNVLAKLEYVNQKYNTRKYSDGAGFKGVMFEAGISL